MVSLELNRNLRRSPATGQWRVVIPKSELKNHYSKQAQDIDRPYSEATCKAIDRYVDEARIFLVGARQSQIFFLGPASGLRASEKLVAAAGYKLSIYAFDYAIRKHLNTYFGAHQGMNFFRHLVATAILKDDPSQVDVAAAELNDATSTISANYGHLIQADKLRLANKWRAEKRRKRDDDGGGGGDLQAEPC